MNAAEVETLIHSKYLGLDIVTLQSNTTLDPAEKTLLVFDSVREGRAVIFEGGLRPTEEAMLIEESMKLVDLEPETFFGIEIHAPTLQTKARGIFRKAHMQYMTVVTPVDYNVTVNLV